MFLASILKDKYITIKDVVKTLPDPKFEVNLLQNLIPFFGSSYGNELALDIFGKQNVQTYLPTAFDANGAVIPSAIGKSDSATSSSSASTPSGATNSNNNNNNYRSSTGKTAIAALEYRIKELLKDEKENDDIFNYIDVSMIKILPEQYV